MSEAQVSEDVVPLLAERISYLERDKDDCLVPTNRASHLKEGLKKTFAKYVAIGNIDVIHPKDCLPGTEEFTRWVVRYAPANLVKNVRGYVIRSESEIKADSKQRVAAIDAGQTISRVRLIGNRE